MIRWTVDVEYKVQNYLYEDGAERDLMFMSFNLDTIRTRLPGDHLISIF